MCSCSHCVSEGVVWIRSEFWHCDHPPAWASREKKKIELRERRAALPSVGRVVSVQYFFAYNAAYCSFLCGLSFSYPAKIFPPTITFRFWALFAVTILLKWHEKVCFELKMMLFLNVSTLNNWYWLKTEVYNRRQMFCKYILYNKIQKRNMYKST